MCVIEISIGLAPRIKSQQLPTYTVSIIISYVIYIRERERERDWSSPYIITRINCLEFKFNKMDDVEEELNVFTASRSPFIPRLRERRGSRSRSSAPSTRCI